MPVALAAQPLSIRFGGGESACELAKDGVRMTLAIPALGPAEQETIGPSRQSAETTCETCGDFLITRGEGWVSGCVVRDTEFPYERSTLQLYRDLFDIVGDDQPIYRIWNYLPDINGKTDGLENYRWFNVGRHRAYRERFDLKMPEHISAASSVGMGGQQLALSFIAGDAPVRGIENPEQVPAHRYPDTYGPKSPCFIRGATARIEGVETAFLSGTSSIRGHGTVGRGDLSAQFDTTIENIRIVARRMGCPTAVSFDSPLVRQFKFYLRHAEDLPLARELFTRAVGERTAADTIFLQADICRGDLGLEIEGIFSDPQRD